MKKYSHTEANAILRRILSKAIDPDYIARFDGHPVGRAEINLKELTIRAGGVFHCLQSRFNGGYTRDELNRICERLEVFRATNRVELIAV